MIVIEEILDFLTDGTTRYEKAIGAAVITQEIFLSIISIGVVFLFLIGYGDWVDNHYPWFALMMLVSSFVFFYCQYVYKKEISSVWGKRLSIVFMLLFMMLILGALKVLAVIYCLFTVGFFQFYCHCLPYIKPQSIRKYGLWFGAMFVIFYIFMCFYCKVGFNLSSIICFIFVVGVMIKQLHTCFMLGFVLTEKPTDLQGAALQKQVFERPLLWGYLYAFTEFVDFLSIIQIFSSRLYETKDNR